MRFESLDIIYPLRCYCDSLVDDHKGLCIKFSSDYDDRILAIKFSYPLSYRKIDEGDFLLTLSMLPQENKVFSYEVLESDFLKWYTEQTLGISERHNIRSFLFLSGNDCIEVLSTEKPEFYYS